MRQKKLDTTWVPDGSIIANTWNPNKQTEFIYEKTRESLLEFGFLDPIKVRSLQSGEKEIIDGEHRWKLMQEMFPSIERRGNRYFYVQKQDDDEKLYPVPKQFANGLMPIIDYGSISDSVARELTIILNNTRGESDEMELADLIKELDGMVGREEVEKLLPYPAEELAFLMDVVAGGNRDVSISDGPQDPNELWKDMPEFVQEDDFYQRITITFFSESDVQEFAKLIGRTITEKTRYLHFPEVDNINNKDYHYESQISK